MDKIYGILNRRPGLFEQSKHNIWENPHISKGMLEAHLDKSLDSATRNFKFVQKSALWIKETLPPQQHRRLLDLGCGPGIYAELFYKCGYDVTGIDLSERSIQYARDSAEEKNMDIRYLMGDYTDTMFENRYDLVTMIYCDFGVLPGNVRTELLKKVYHLLSPHGVFLFDVFTPQKYNDLQESRSWEIEHGGFWHEGLSLILRSFYRYDKDHTFLNQYVVITEDEVSHYNVWEHTFTFEELRRDVKNAGFDHISFFGNAAGESYNTKENTICVLAGKK